MTKTKKGPNKRNQTRQSGELSPEDRAVWTHVTENIEPLHANKITQDTLPSHTSSHDHSTKSIRTKTQPITPNTITPTNLIFEHGRAPGLDKRTQLRLRRGQVGIEARLDLHGMTQTEAYERLHRFLEAAYQNGRRTVLVITGKGLRRDGEIGVLRRAVPGWLNQPPLRDWIKAFDHAAPRDGGEGALYILLRRRK